MHSMHFFNNCVMKKTNKHKKKTHRKSAFYALIFLTESHVEWNIMITNLYNNYFFLVNYLFVEKRWQYDNVLTRLSAHKLDCWRGIAPSNVHIDYNPTPPIFAAKFANCQNHRNIIAIANEDGRVS